MAEHPNVTILRGIFDAFNAGDMETALSALADDVVWHYIGSDQPLRGRAAVMEQGPPSFDADISAEVHDILANDDHAVAMLKVHAVRGDRTLDYDVAEIYHMRGGKCVERWAISQDTARIADFFA